MNHPIDNLCLSCLQPNAKSAKYCENCNTPLGEHATIDPVQSAIYEGRGIAQGVAKPHSGIVVVGMWILFVPFILIYLILGGISIFQSDGVELIGIGFAAGFGVLAVFFGFLVLKTTKNYLKHVKLSKSSKDENE